MPKARTSAYKKNYGTTVEYAFKNAEIKDVRVDVQDEKDRMKKLNNRLVNYIDKVHDLETANKILTAENAKLRKLQNTPETDVALIFEEKLEKIQLKVAQLHHKNVELAIERDNVLMDFEEISEKLKTMEEENKELETEVKSLRTDVDDATIERVNLESKIENQQEAMELMKKVYEAEMKNLRNQIQPHDAPELNAERPSMLPDLTDVIANVRQQQEEFNAKSLEDLDRFYKEKVDNLKKQLKSAQEEICNLRADNNEKRKKIQQLEMEIDAFRKKNDTMERNIEHLEDRLAREASENQELLKQLHKELDSTKEDLGKYLKDYQNLNSLKLSLEQEIAIYHKLLSGEETRIADIDMQVVVTKEVEIKKSSPNRSRSSSRSSSKASSKSSSKASSRSASRASSPEKNTAEIVAEMLGQEERRKSSSSDSD